jgi:hypothetical protein
MKQIYILFFIATFSLSFDLKSQIVSIPDSTFESFLIQNGFDSDGLINGQMSSLDASAIDSIEIFGNSIEDLTGLESFINMRYLRLIGFGGDSINLTLMDSLEAIYLYSIGVSNIDLTQNSILSSMAIYNTPISGIDLSGNPNLIVVNLQSVDISTLDLSNNLDLKSIVLLHFTSDCEEIDFSMNTELEWIWFKDIGLKKLDLSNNHNITTFKCESNPIEQLNFKNGNNLNISLDYNAINFIVEDCPNLNCIQVDNAAYSTNNWTNVDPHMSFSYDCNYPTNINSNDIQTIKCFPNPTNYTFKVETPTDYASISITSLDGRNVLTATKQPLYHIDHLEAGIYIVSIYGENRVYSKSIVVE